MNTIIVLHREAQDTTQLRTPTLDKYFHESMLPTFHGSYFSSADGKESFRLKDNKIIFLRNVIGRKDIDAALELLKKKSVKEITPLGDDNFLGAVHQAGERHKIDVLHPDYYEAMQKVQIMDEVKARMMKTKSTRTKGMRIR